MLELKIELEGDEDFVLPRPYRRRYTPNEIKFWRRKVDALVKAGVLRKSESGQLNPSNLVPKKRDDVVLLDDFRIIDNLRGLNKRVKTKHYGLTRLDTLIHHLQGSTCFAKGDNTSGYWQINLEESFKKYTEFDGPVGPYEYNRVPMGSKNAAAWYQHCMEQWTRRRPQH